jgi:hypothetical protein
MEQYVEDLSVEDISTQTADMLLDSLSLEVMESSILDQIREGNSRRDFLETVLAKFKAINEHAEDDAARGIRSEMVDWANSLIHAIINQYHLGYNNLDEDSLDSLDILEALYNFFVIEKRENTIEFFKKYIDIHKKEIAEHMGLNARSGDITTMANRKKNIAKDNVPILSNLDEVIQFIASGAGITSEEFLDVIDDGDFYTASVIGYFNDGMLCGDFFNEYIRGEVGTYADNISMELRSSIRTYLATT